MLDSQKQNQPKHAHADKSTYNSIKAVLNIVT